MGKGGKGGAKYKIGNASVPVKFMKKVLRNKVAERNSAYIFCSAHF